MIDILCFTLKSMHVTCLARAHDPLARPLGIAWLAMFCAPRCRPGSAGLAVGWPRLAQQAAVIALQLLAIVLLPHLAAALLRAPLRRAGGLPLRYANAAATQSRGKASS